ncbi:MAG: hypothetical protein ABFC77_14865 [Thermoguttaceae bacterium]
MPRHWNVVFSTPSEARTEKKATSDRQKILDAMKEFPNGECKSNIFKAASVRANDTTRAVFDALVEDGKLVGCKVKKKNAATYEGYMLATAV